MDIKMKLKATVTGTTCDGKDFAEELVFTMLPPKSDNHYGTGYYMTVDMSISGRQLIDVRYERTTNIDVLADRFIQNWYGKNAHSVAKDNND